LAGPFLPFGLERENRKKFSLGHFFTCIKKRTKENAAVHSPLCCCSGFSGIPCAVQNTGALRNWRSLYSFQGCSESLCLRHCMASLTSRAIQVIFVGKLLLPTIDTAARLCEMVINIILLYFNDIDFYAQGS
jgi:hypothetical protein